MHRFTRRAFLQMATAAGAGLLASACSLVPPPPPRMLPRSVFFIGDSFTFENLGLDSLMQDMAAVATPPMKIETGSATIGGAPLEQLWRGNHALDRIHSGTWDVVVLQEDLAMGTDVPTFFEYAAKFDEEIRKARGRTVLYMTWEYLPPLNRVRLEEIAQAYNQIGAQLRVPVAPVGRARERAHQERPDLNLYAHDGQHSSMAGTYLGLCVLYATIFGLDPEGSPYQPQYSLQYTVTAEDCAFLQRIAWEMVQEYQAEQAAGQ